MTEQAMNVAIALACGWKHVRYETPAVNHGNMEWIGIPPSCKKATSSAWMCKIIPNYTGDLNAMHEAVKTLTFTQRRIYRLELQRIVSSGLKEDGVLVEMSECIDATAKQRAEAFLRTLGKWVEE